MSQLSHPNSRLPSAPWAGVRDAMESASTPCPRADKVVEPSRQKRTEQWPFEIHSFEKVLDLLGLIATNRSKENVFPRQHFGISGGNILDFLTSGSYYLLETSLSPNSRAQLGPNAGRATAFRQLSFA